ncbi:MAG: twin-arginine translocation signal domain-containing protein, partial [Candidatus Halalkalibacterium sp. M3_1C_030]
MKKQMLQIPESKGLSRRGFIRKSAALATGLAAGSSGRIFGAPILQKKSDHAGTVINGVEIGIIAPYALRGVSRDLDVEELLTLITGLGINAVEMQSPPVEAFAGISSDNATGWRISANMDKFEELRRMYNEAGVRFYGYKHSLT